MKLDYEEIARTCPHFICQRDRNEEIDIVCCNLLCADPDKDHEGNCGQYPCPEERYKIEKRKPEHDETGWQPK